MTGMGDRLRKARETAGFGSAAKAAAAFGIAASTYRAHENGQNEFSPEEAERYARKFGTTAAYLLTGGGDGRPQVIPVMGYLGAGAEVEPDFEQVPEDGMEDVVVPFPLPDEMIAFKVRGESMLPKYENDEILIVYRERRKPIEAFYGKIAAVRTSDGRRFVKTIMRGPGSTVNLVSWNAAPIEAVRLDWIGEIFAVLPSTVLHNSDRRVRPQGQSRPRA